MTVPLTRGGRRAALEAELTESCRHREQHTRLRARLRCYPTSRIVMVGIHIFRHIYANRTNLHELHIEAKKRDCCVSSSLYRRQGFTVTKNYQDPMECPTLSNSTITSEQRRWIDAAHGVLTSDPSGSQALSFLDTIVRRGGCPPSTWHNRRYEEGWMYRVDHAVSSETIKFFVRAKAFA